MHIINYTKVQKSGSHNVINNANTRESRLSSITKENQHCNSFIHISQTQKWLKTLSSIRKVPRLAKPISTKVFLNKKMAEKVFVLRKILMGVEVANREAEGDHSSRFSMVAGGGRQRAAISSDDSSSLSYFQLLQCY